MRQRMRPLESSKAAIVMQCRNNHPSHTKVLARQSATSQPIASCRAKKHPGGTGKGWVEYECPEKLYQDSAGSSVVACGRIVHNCNHYVSGGATYDVVGPGLDLRLSGQPLEIRIHLSR